MEKQIQEQRPIEQVRRIVLRGGTDVIFRRSDTLSMIVSGDTAEAVAAVKTDIQGDKLVIETVFPGTNEPFTRVTRSGSVQVFHQGVGSAIIIDGDLVIGNSITNIAGRHVITTTTRTIVTITLPEIAEVCVKGSGDVILSDIQQATLSLRIEGAGDITVDGKVAQLDVEICGSGDVDTRDLIADYADLSISGSGDIKAFARAEARARVAGSGDIVIHGNPPIRDKSVVGSGRVKFK